MTTYVRELRRPLPCAQHAGVREARHGGRSLCHTSYAALSVGLENWVCGTGSRYRVSELVGVGAGVVPASSVYAERTGDEA